MSLPRLVTTVFDLSPGVSPEAMRRRASQRRCVAGAMHMQAASPRYVALKDSGEAAVSVMPLRW